jgi:flagellar motor switch protein FliG
MNTPPALRPTTNPGATRAAKLMLAMGPDAGPVWAQLTAQETQTITALMNDLHADEALGDTALLESFLRDSQAASTVARAQDAGSPVEAALQTAAPEALAVIAGQESPQIAAYLMSRLAPGKAASVLRMLDEGAAITILKRMVSYCAPPANLRCVIDDSLRATLERLGTGRGGGHEQVARIFDQLDPRREGGLLAGLEALDPQTGRKVRSLMFGFDDLVALPAAGIQTLLATAERADLVHALKGARNATREAFFANMTQRAGELVREEITSLGGVRRSQVEAAQRLLVDTARDLIRRGDIRLEPAEDDELVE